MLPRWRVWPARNCVVALEADIPPVTSALSRVLMNLPEVIRNAETLSAQAEQSSWISPAGKPGQADCR
jgi:hypothetical protein